LTIDSLSTLVSDSGLNKSEFESIVFQLSPKERRLFLFLSENGEQSTATLRNKCSIGNVSDCANSLNKKLKTYEDERKVICTTRRHVNQFDEVGILGYWKIVREEK